jgi:hypothetical protein
MEEVIPCSKLQAVIEPHSRLEKGFSGRDKGFLRIASGFLRIELNPIKKASGN